MGGRKNLISVVLPAYNEGAGIQKTIRTLSTLFEQLPSCELEMLIIDDGSRDNTYAKAAEMVDLGFPVRALRLSRNFGKEAALLAGLSHARGDAVLTIDADLQHPPALIPSMIKAWEGGAKVIHGIKRDRGDEPVMSTLRAAVVNKLLTILGGIDVRNSSDFKLLDRVVVDVLTRQLPERSRFYRGLADWVGFPSVTLHFDVAQRETGKSGFSLKSLLSLTLTAMVSFTSLPLRIVTILGGLTFILGIGVGSDALYSWMEGDAISGFLTMIFTLLIIGSFIMISLGVIGEYIAKIYDEIKRRPTFIVDLLHERKVEMLVQPAPESTPISLVEKIRG
jgi:glycosyltransferase involved in cell wall biosynthesis